MEMKFKKKNRTKTRRVKLRNEIYKKSLKTKVMQILIEKAQSRWFKLVKRVEEDKIRKKEKQR